MRILHVTKSYLPQSQTFVINTLVLLKSIGTENFLLTGTLNRTIDFSIKRCLSLFPVPRSLNRFTLVHKVLSRIEPILLMSSRNRIQSYLRKINVDLIHFHFGWSYELFSEALKAEHLPTVISFHGSDVSLHPRRSKNYREMIIDLSGRDEVTFTTPSQFLKNELLSWGIPEDKVTVLYNTFDSKLFTDLKKTSTLDKSYLRVINVSRMISWKGQRFLIEAFANFLKQNKGHLTLIGGGDELPRMIELAERLGISGSVSFLGELPHDRVKELMLEHDVYVQPSTVDEKTNQCETFGVVLLEAMASGLIVVATKTGGMPEVLHNLLHENQFYFLVNQKSSYEIALVFQHIASAEYIYKSNHDYASDKLSKFSNEHYISCLKGIYGKVLKC